MNWSPVQERALDAVAAWLRAADRPIFFLAGYAGTGKTTLARHLAANESGKVLFGSFTGKAALVMRNRGCEGAATLHSLMYRVVDKNKEPLRRLEAELEVAQAQTLPDLVRIAELQSDAERLRAELRGPRFQLNPDGPLSEASLLVVDEVSMVDERLGEDLLTFGVPILALGDPFQLPPIRGTGFLTSWAPDIVLDEIHRQAAGDPIIELATRVREGRQLQVGEWGRTRVIRRADFDPATLMPDAQILCGRNVTRHDVNRKRRARLGLPQGVVVPGDRVVCLRNNPEIGVLNGGTHEVLSAVELKDEDKFVLSLDGNISVIAHAGPFRGEEIPFWTARDAEHFDFGYCLTVHKAQGSQWREVVLIDESWCFRAEAARHRYTGITRAVEALTVLL